MSEAVRPADTLSDTVASSSAEPSNPLPDESGSLDERLREACARLGVDVPAARGAETGDEAMREAHEHAVTRMDELRTRWRTRVASEEKVLVKIRASQVSSVSTYGSTFAIGGMASLTGRR